MTLKNIAQPLTPVLLGLLLVLAAAADAGAMGARPAQAPTAAANATANATAAAASKIAAGAAHPRRIPDDAAALAQYQVLRDYFTRSATLDDRLPELFSRRVRDDETQSFLMMRAIINRRGQLERFRNAHVDLSGLVFTRVTGDPDLARIRVTGSYLVGVTPVVERIPEDALYVLLPEMGQWRIFERRPGWRP